MLYELIKTCQQVVDKVWGKELWIVNNQDYCGKVMVLNQKFRCSIHHHQVKKETFLLISGKILLEIQTSDSLEMDSKIILTPGMSITIMPYTRHRFTGLNPVSEIIEFSSRHFEHDSYRDTTSEEIPDDEWEVIQNEF